MISARDGAPLKLVPVRLCLDTIVDLASDVSLLTAQSIRLKNNNMYYYKGTHTSLLLDLVSVILVKAGMPFLRHSIDTLSPIRSIVTHLTRAM